MGTDPKLPTPHPDVAYQQVHGEAVLVHLRTNRIYSLNATAGRFWALLCEGDNRVQIEGKLSEEFDVGAEALRREVDELLVSLTAAGLVRWK